MQPGSRHVLRIRLAKVASPTQRGLALLQCCEATILTAALHVVKRAPRIVLSFCWSVEHNRRSDDTEHKQDTSHKSPSRSGLPDGYPSLVRTPHDTQYCLNQWIGGARRLSCSAKTRRAVRCIDVRDAGSVTARAMKPIISLDRSGRWQHASLPQTSPAASRHSLPPP